MKPALRKSPIPESRTFVAKSLKENNFDPNWHFHPEYQLFVVLKGSGTRFIGDHVRHFKEGDMVFTGPDLPHLWKNDCEDNGPGETEDVQGIVIYFHEDFLGESVLQKEELIKLKQLFLKSHRGMELLGETATRVQKMMTDLLEMEGLTSVIQLMKILDCLANTSDFRLLTSAGYTNSLRESDTERMNDVHNFVMKNFRKKVCLDEVAALANMTPSSFSRYFKTHANKTFSEFVSEIRIGNACKLLVEQNVSVTQACYQSGFQTLSNFNKQFKAITKRTPMTYKKEYGIK